MSWVAVAIGGAGLVTAAGGAYASNQAADAAARGSRAGIAEQRRQFDTVVGLQQPAMVTGTGALNTIARLMGLPYQEYAAPGSPSATGGNFTGSSFGSKQIVKLLKQGHSFDQIQELGYYGGTLTPKRLKRLTKAGLTLDQIQQLQSGMSPEEAAAAENPIITPEGPDPSVFQESPDYQFRRDEGLAAVDRSAAARSGALSGNAVRATEEFGSGLASQEYGNFFERLMRVAGLGGAATNNTSNAAQNTGNNVAQLLTQQGNARASGILGQANSVGEGINTSLNAWLLNRGGYFGAPARGGGGGGGIGVPTG